jgi:hypothetical protein
VRRKAARVFEEASSTRNVWLIARVSQVPAIPAAVHAAGGVQQYGVNSTRLMNVTEERTKAAPKSTCQNSAALLPSEAKSELSPTTPSTAMPGAKLAYPP